MQRQDTEAKDEREKVRVFKTRGVCPYNHDRTRERTPTDSRGYTERRFAAIRAFS